jgi:hypothetical protein
MAKKSSVRQAATFRETEQAACQYGQVTVESVAADLFARSYRAGKGYKTEHFANQAIEAAEEFMKQLAHR